MERMAMRRRQIAAILPVLLLVACSNGSGGAVPTTTTPTVTTQPPATVPNVEGMRVDNARNALEAAAFEVSISTKYTDEAPKGTVLHQSVDAGTSVDVGRTIVLLVAKAFPIIPNVVGEKLTVARRTLSRHGFDVRVTKRVSSRPKDTVISQTPAGGTEARPGRQVMIVVAKPAPPAPAPNCTPGYSPCLIYHGGADYDCYGGSGNGPYYTEPGITYRVTGSDPYGLDANNNGYGCE
jgi:hypothetical protein